MGLIFSNYRRKTEKYNGLIRRLLNQKEKESASKRNKNLA
jgi:hypothetical protein